MRLSYQPEKLPTQTQSVKKVFEVIHKQYTENLLEKTLQYDMEVTLLGQVSTETFGYEMDRTNLLIDNEEPNTVFEQLAVECGKALFPIRFSANQEGDVVHIYNYENILERWQIIKKGLLNYYEGDMAVSYIKCNNDNLKNQEIIKKLITNQLFAYFFLNPLEENSQDDNTAVIWKTAPFMDFEGIIPMQKVIKNDVPGELVLQSDSPFIKIEAKYTFDERNKSIDSCTSSIVQDDKTKIELSFITKQVEVSQN